MRCHKLFRLDFTTHGFGKIECSQLVIFQLKKYDVEVNRNILVVDAAKHENHTYVRLNGKGILVPMPGLMPMIFAIIKLWSKTCIVHILSEMLSCAKSTFDFCVCSSNGKEF